jgi:hypothetical protein
VQLQSIADKLIAAAAAQSKAHAAVKGRAGAPAASAAAASQAAELGRDETDEFGHIDDDVRAILVVRGANGCCCFPSFSPLSMPLSLILALSRSPFAR